MAYIAAIPMDDVQLTDNGCLKNLGERDVAFLRKYEVWVFLISIVIANALFTYGIVAEILPQRAYNLGRFLLLGLVLVGILFVTRGFGGVFGLIKPLMVWRIAPKWLVFSLLWAPIFCALFLIGKGIVTGTSAFEMNFETVSKIGVMRTIFIGSLIGEIVWVSYSINALARQFSFMIAAMIVGTFWALWWVPIVIFNIGVVPDLPLVAQWINMVGVAMMCGFVYYHTRSGLCVLLLQLVFNSSILIFPVTPADAGAPSYWVFSIIYLAVALVAYMLVGPKPLLARPQPAQS